MASLQQIQSRLKAVKNIGQITKAMEVVSATKMRRAQEVALDSREYAFKALSLLETVRKNTPGTLSSMKLLEEREAKKTLVVLVASDRGLAGSFNSQITKAFDKFIREEDKVEGHEYSYIAVGKKAHQYLVKKNVNIVDFFEGYGDMVHRGDIAPLTETAVRGFMNDDWDRVVTISTHFHSTLKQEPLTRQILPVNLERIAETVAEIVPKSGKYSENPPAGGGHKVEGHDSEYIFEPTPEEALKTLVPHLVNMQIYQLVLEANASEHSARMVAMKNASNNASELKDDLTLEFNKARQAAITKEMIELSSSQAALN